MEGFGEFYRIYREKLFSYLMRMTGDYPFSCDILQESFTRILENYGPESRTPSLLFTIARNAIFDEARKRKRIESLHSNAEEATVDAEQYIIIRDSYRRVLAAMQQLEQSDRDILAMVVSTDFSYRQVAALAGISEANVKVRIHRARTKLKEIIQGDT